MAKINKADQTDQTDQTVRMEYVCKYAPVELLAAFGIESRLCDPLPDDLAAADKLIHRNVCSFSRALIEQRVKEGGNALLLTDCCDSIRRACDVLRREGQTVYFLNLPHKGECCGRELYQKNLLQLAEDLAACSGKGFDVERFLAACGKAKEMRVRQELEVPEIMEDAGEIGKDRPYLAVIGARMSEEVLNHIRKISPLPIQNYTCVGTHHIGRPLVTDDKADTAISDGMTSANAINSINALRDKRNLANLMDWYAGELLSQPPCMRMTDVSSRRMLTEDPHIKGIIYHSVSFCDYYGFEYASLKKTLKTPVLKIETDYTPQAMAQLQNRVAAFLEKLEWGTTAVPTNTKAVLKGYTAGVDSGSTTTKAVILDERGDIVSFAVLPTGVGVAASAEKAFVTALMQAGLAKEAVLRTVSTGYGRSGIGFGDREVTEITCHARGAFYLNPRIRTVIDMGGQDSKVIRLDETGAVKDFAMNDKCAAGTGRFLEMMAQSLGITLKEMATCGLKWHEEIVISSMCSVFAQSEVVSLIAAGKKLEDIVHGLNRSVAAKVIALSGRAGMKPEYMMTGGVAKNSGVVRAIEEKLGCPITLPEEPEICGALGAALLAWEDLGFSVEACPAYQKRKA